MSLEMGVINPFDSGSQTTKKIIEESETSEGQSILKEVSGHAFLKTF